MKKITILSILFFGSASLFAQEKGVGSASHNSFELQAKGSYNSTWLLNKNISDADASQNYANAWGYNYGLGFNAYFGNIGVGIEGLMGNHVGGYSGVIETKDSAGVLLSKENYRSKVTLNVIQIPLFFKLRSEFGAYLEVGPQFNMVSSANYNRTGTGLNADTAVTTYYSSSYISAALGFGFKFKFGDGPLSLDAGLRLNYGLTDLKGVDGLGRDLSNAIFYKKAEPTNAAAGGIVVALTYQLNHKKR
jgi:hypothetical protein